MRWLRKFVRDLIIGNDRYITSTVQYRNSMFRGVIAIISIILGPVYILINYVNTVDRDAIWFLLLMVFGMFSFWLNRMQKFMLANLSLLLLSNGFIYIFASSETTASGIFSFFIATGLITLVLFGYRNRKIAILFSLVTYGFALVAYSGWLPARAYSNLPDQFVQISFLINFSIAFLVAIMVTNFAIQLHHDIEHNLRLSEQSLLLTSKELNVSRERYEMAVKGTKAGIYEINLVANTLYFGPQFKRMLGYDSDELNHMTVKNFLDLIHFNDAALREETILQSAGATYQVELRIKTKDGSYRWVSDSGVSKSDRSRNITFITGSIIDIAERKLAEQKILNQNDLLAKANDELDRFVYSASHDLRAPLSSLLGLITVAEKTDRPHEVMQCLDMMRHRVETMEGFIKEITDYSRNSRQELVFTSIKIRSLIQEVVNNLKFTRGAENIRMDIQVNEQEKFVTDSNRLKIVLNNLIANALKYHDPTKADPYIVINALKGEGYYILEVGDNGAGILPEHTDKIFNMFYRASENAEGSGLGLYIVRETLTKLSGNISVNSTIGVGSTFTVKIPSH